MSASTSTPFGTSLSAGAEPNRALSTVIRRSSTGLPLTAEETGNGKLGNDRRRLLAAATATAANARDGVGERIDHARRILGGATRDVERRRGDRSARRGDQIGRRAVFGDREVDRRVG